MRHRTIILGVIISVFVGAAADARPRHVTHRQQAPIVCDERGCSDRAVPASNASIAIDANGNPGVIGRRPDGCPRAFCGCEASIYVFGHIRPELNLASNWAKRFPRTSPAPGMVAVRNHHVMVLMNHVDGRDWFVHDGNSGGGLTREHIMSIGGYIIVNPHGA